MTTKKSISAAGSRTSVGNRRLLVTMLAAAGVSLLVAVNPFGGLSQPTDLPLVCLGVTGVCAALLLPRAGSFEVLARWRVAWALGALAAWAIVSSLVSGRAFAATFGTNGTALGWPVVVLGAILVLAAAFHERRVRELLLWVAAAVLLVEFATTIVEMLTNAFPFGTLSNSSNTGEVVALLAPLVFWWGVRSKALWSRVWRIAVSATALWTTVVGTARVSSVVLVLALLGWGALWVGRRYGRPAGVASASALGVVLVGGVGFIALKWSSLSGGAIGEFWRSRWGLWEPALRAVAARPVFGFGPDGYQFAVTQVGTRGAYTAWAYWPPSVDPHNLLLWFATSMGLVGVGLFLWASLEVGRSWLEQSRVEAPIPVGPLAVGVVLYAASAFASPAALQTLPLAFIVLGASLRPEATSAQSPSRAFEIGLRSVAVVLALLVGAYGLTRLSIANRLQVPRPAASQGAADLWRVDPYLYYNASIRWGYMASRSPQVQQDQLDLIAIRRAASLEPSNGFYGLELARTMASYGMPQADVEAQYKTAMRLAPASAEARASYAEYLISLSRLGEAKQLLDEAARLAPALETDRVFAVYYRALGDAASAQRYDAMRAELANTLTGGLQR